MHSRRFISDYVRFWILNKPGCSRPPFATNARMSLKCIVGLAVRCDDIKERVLVAVLCRTFQPLQLQRKHPDHTGFVKLLEVRIAVHSGTPGKAELSTSNKQADDACTFEERWNRRSEKHDSLCRMRAAVDRASACSLESEILFASHFLHGAASLQHTFGAHRRAEDARR